MQFGITGFLFFVLRSLFDLIILALIVYAVLSWLIAFNVINTRNPAVWRIMDLLDRIVSPILAPFRAVVPNIGGLDISFILAFIVIRGIQIYFLSVGAEDSMRQLIGN